MNKKKDSFNKASVIIALSFILGTITYAWTGAPAGIPPANNVDAPVNVGDSIQYKSGSLGIDGLFRAYSNLIVDGVLTASGTFRIPNGSGNGKVLISDTTGNASWVSTSSLGISGGISSITGGSCAVGQVVNSITFDGVVTCGEGGGGSGPKKIDSRLTSGSFTFNKPTGAVSAHVQLHGGGAAGTIGSGNYGGSGGGAGGYSEKIIDVSGINSLSGTVGAGGAPNSGAGGSSSVTGYMTATGGSGRTPGSGNGGDINFVGQLGDGGSGGYDGGSGGDGYFGGGGSHHSIHSGQKTTDGIRGGGGGGGGSNNGGGYGGPGFVIIYWY